MSARRAAPPARRLRLLGIALGAGLLAWLPIEETSPAGAILFAAAIAALAGAALFARFAPPAGPPAWAYPAAGLLAGLSVAPLALFLMAFKTGAHGHAVPDYSPAQVRSVIGGTPLLALAGLLAGLAALLWRRARRERP